MKYFLLLCLTLITFACSVHHDNLSNIQYSDDEMLRFAEVNCLFQYFKKKDYDLKDIRAISGGIVEMGSYSAARYRKVALLVKEYDLEIKSKNDIDPDLQKCFCLRNDAEFVKSIEKIKSAVLDESEH